MSITFRNQSMLLIATAFIVVIMTIVFIIITTIALNVNEKQKESRDHFIISLSYVQNTFNWKHAKNIFIREFCRFSKKKMLKVLSHLKLEDIRYRNKQSVIFEIALTILCARLSYSKRFKTLMHHFDHFKNWIFIIFNDVVVHLTRRYKKMLHWFKRLIYEKTFEYAAIITNFENSWCFWNFIDDIVNFIYKSKKQMKNKNDQRDFYLKHKHQHQFNYQIIITFNDLIINFMNFFVDKRNDWNMYRNSDLTNYFQKLNASKQVCERLWLYDDSAYQNCWNIIEAKKTYANCSLSSKNRLLNRSLIFLRIEMKHVFDMHVNSWQCRRVNRTFTWR